MTFTESLKQRAHRLGFQVAGVCPAVTPAGIHRFRDWLAAGYAGEMDYLSSRASAYEHPRHILDGARSLLMLGMNYFSDHSGPAAQGEGRVSCYAWGSADYHNLIRSRLQELVNYLGETRPSCHARGIVDTAPLLEREFAQLAGLGWIGKNTLLLNRRLGSWFFLAAIVTDCELDYDQPFTADHCGSCRACLDACPTSAFPQPYVLDATRCISYLTIELRGPMPHDLRANTGQWLFGCDICQEVCPWNHRVPATAEREFLPVPGHDRVSLESLFRINDDEFRGMFRHTPLWRAKRRGLLRNAAIVLGNQPSLDAIPTLQRGLIDPEPLVRGASAWALGQLSPRDATQAILKEQLLRETDALARQEILAVIG